MLQLKEFLSIFDELVNEFRIINEHFEVHVRSSIDDYDTVFHRWRQDIQRRFRQVQISHRWASNNPLVFQNTLFFIVKYGSVYNCEVKYLFTLDFRDEFPILLQKSLDTMLEALFRFQLFVLTFKTQYVVISREVFEREFLEWKKTLYKQADVYAVDFLWVDEKEKEEKDVLSNVVELTVSQKDNFVILVRYDLEDPPQLIKEIRLEQDIS